MTAPDKPDAVPRGEAVTEEELLELAKEYAQEASYCIDCMGVCGRPMHREWDAAQNMSKVLAAIDRAIASYRALRDENAKLRKDLHSLGVMTEDHLAGNARLRIDNDKLRVVAEAAAAVVRFERDVSDRDWERNVDDQRRLVETLTAAGYDLRGKEAP